MSELPTLLIHPPLLEGMRAALPLITREGRYADKVLEHLFRTHRKWGARDRALVAETIYGVVRYLRALAAVVGEAADPRDYVAAHVLLYQRRQPVWKGMPAYPFDAWAARFRDVQEVDAVRESFPDWLDAEGRASWGAEWPGMMRALNQPAPVVLRVNTLKATVARVRDDLASQGFETEASAMASEALILKNRVNVLQTRAFKQGWFEVQDEASQVVGDFCGVQPGQCVVDACAGAGGKSLHLAALLQNRGKIVALDVEGYKLDELKARARRNGAFNIETHLIDSTKVIKRLEGRADLLLIDAPCTGTGVLRRNPDAKWKLQPEVLQRILAQQRQILEDYPSMLKRGGTLVYATCSLLRQENGGQVRDFLAKHPGFVLVEEKTLDPLHHATDGFYMARLKKG